LISEIEYRVRPHIRTERDIHHHGKQRQEQELKRLPGRWRDCHAALSRILRRFNGRSSIGQFDIAAMMLRAVVTRILAAKCE